MTLTLKPIAKTAAAVVTGTLSLTVLSGVFASDAQALSMIGNLTVSTTPGQSVAAFSSSTISTTQFKEIEFTTPSTEYILTNVLLHLGSFNTLGVDDSPVVEIVQGGVGSTNVVLTLNQINPTPTANNSFRIWEFTSASSFTFLANTTYSLRLTETTNSYNWGIDSDPQTTPTGLATFNQFYFTDIDTPALSTTSGTYNSFQINVDAVPFDFSATPGLLILVGIFGVTQLRKKFTKFYSTDFTIDDQN